MASITEVMVSLIPALADIFRPQETWDNRLVDGGDIIDELIRNVKSGIRWLYDILLPLVDLFQRHFLFGPATAGLVCRTLTGTTGRLENSFLCFTYIAEILDVGDGTD